MNAMLRLATLGLVSVSCTQRAELPPARQQQGLAWGEEQKLVASDAAEIDQFGYSVSMNGDRAIVGAYGESVYRGAAYVFVHSAGSWLEEQKLVVNNALEADNFGWSVSLSGDRALVGAYGTAAYRGAGYVFVRDGSAWIEEQALVPSDAVELDQVGYAVSLTEDRALLGAYGSKGGRGAAYVFVRNGSTWTEEQKLVPHDAADDDHFGSAVSLIGERCVIGAPGHANARGAAYVFARGAASWIEEQELVASDGTEDDQLGNAVSLADDRVAVAAYWKDDLRGAAYLFERSGSSWAQAQRLSGAGGANGPRFGNSISLGRDRLVIGEVGKDNGRGAAHVYVRSGSAWSEEQALVASDGEIGDLFAWSVALGSGSAVVGAYYTDQLRGAVYAFSVGAENGAACSADAECASGHCVDARCCNMDCAGACGACSLAEGASGDGVCTLFPAGSVGSPNCGALACNGDSSQCALCQRDADCPETRYCSADHACELRRQLGEACGDDDASGCSFPGCRACQSGVCRDGVCCDAACDGLCVACTARLKGSGADGECGPVQAHTDPDGECSDDGVATCQANGFCDGAGACELYPARTRCQPEPCTRGDECTSGHCEDGICCDRVCSPSERCRTELKVSGADGSCGPATAAALGAPCAFDVQCTSGKCVDGICCGATCATERCNASGECEDSGRPSGSDAEQGCGCRFGRTAIQREGFSGALALALLVMWRRKRASLLLD